MSISCDACAALCEENARLKNDRDAMAISAQEAWMEARKLREALVKVRAHTGLPLYPTGDLLLGLLNSIERITDKALAAQAPGGKGNLLPCPFCGAPPKKQEGEPDGYGHRQTRIYCDCGLHPSTGTFASDQTESRWATSAWNRRVYPDAKGESEEELRKAIEGLLDAANRNVGGMVPGVIAGWCHKALSLLARKPAEEVKP